MKNSDIEIIRLTTVSSTNDYLKQIARDGKLQNTVVIADEQTGGKGTKNRSFVSKKGGVYLSVLVKPCSNCTDATLITPMTAVAVRETIEQISGICADIKWVNDVYIKGKKVAGILCESVILPNGEVPYIIVGIGVNLFLPEGGFETEIKDIATSIFNEYNADVKESFVNLLIENFFKFFGNLKEKTFLKKYREHSCVLGKNIVVTIGDTCREAIALSIDDDCRLVVKFQDNTQKTLTSADVSIKV